MILKRFPVKDKENVNPINTLKNLQKNKPNTKALFTSLEKKN